MLKIVMVLLVGWLGSDDWATRELAQQALERFVGTDGEVDVGPVRDGLSSPDPEVARRCRAVMDAYDAVTDPTGLYMGYMDRSLRPDLYDQANRLPAHQDVVRYLQLLRDDAGMGRAELAEVVRKARTRKLSYDVSACTQSLVQPRVQQLGYGCLCSPCLCGVDGVPCQCGDGCCGGLGHVRSRVRGWLSGSR